VISDTHDSLEMVRRASAKFREAGVEAVVHLGDFISPFTLRLLGGELGGVRIVGVLGNNDGEKLGLYSVARELGIDLADHPRALELGGARVLILHGFGSPENTLEIVRGLARSRTWDAVLFGHTHEALKEYINGTLLLNPGDGGGVINRPSIAILDTARMEAEIVWL